MRSLAEAKSRWDATFKDGSSVADLQRAVKFNGPNNPCAAGLRSICWKAFLLWRDAPAEQWPALARAARASYAALCEQHLRFIRHPEQLAALTVDPLADDPDSPWNAARADEAVRDEILQDVRRLPEEPFYHEERVQTMILDVLFLYCKLNPGVGGYRQGMHELLAPIVRVVAGDAVDRTSVATEDTDEVLIAELLDLGFIEHDAYSLFAKLMESAGSFYEVESDTSTEGQQRNTIVERSKYIHDVALMRIDEELANHLRNIEVLPQIFLIRWIRLLFGREFDFDQLLGLWDTIFAYDPALELIDLICVAMLLRIRWTLLEADYSAALQLMLKYPAPVPPHGAHTFVDDAMFLKGHFDVAGGVTLIFKYTGRSPANTSVATPAPSRTVTPPFQKLNTLRQRTLGARSSLSTSARILQQPGGVEALLQGAAKNMMQRGEKLGINQAVRGAMGEIRRNVQGFQETRTSSRGSRTLFGETVLSPEPTLTISSMEARNRQLASMLDDSISNLKQLAASGLDGEKEKQLETVELAAAKIQFVKACLEDQSLTLPEEELPAINTLAIASPTDIKSPTVALDTTPVVMVSSAVEETRTALSSPESAKGSEPPVSPPPPPREVQVEPTIPEVDDKMDTDHHENDTLPPLKSEITNSPPPPPPPELVILPDSPPPTAAATVFPALGEQQRPLGPIPTRSTLAQSSFAWMLEPDTTSSSLPRRPSPFSASPLSLSEGSPSPGGIITTGVGGSSGSSAPKKRVNPRRERNAFLFGEVTADGVVGAGPLSDDQIFGLQPIRKGG